MEKVRRVLVIILLLAALSSGILVLLDYLNRIKAAREYEKLAEMVQTTEQSAETEEEQTKEEKKEGEKEDYTSPVDFERLKSINSQTVGWIRIPDTPVDYPIVQAEDNEKYLHTDFEGKESAGGAIFLDFESASNLHGKNNIIYGHHMKNGSMFKALVNYKDKEFFESHPYFTIYTPEKEIDLRVIAASFGEADPEARRTRFNTIKSLNEYIDKMTSRCSYRIVPEGNVTSLYTLITCSYEFNDARTFVFAVPADKDGNIILVEEGKEPENFLTQGAGK